MSLSFGAQRIATAKVMYEIMDERIRQDEKWGEQNHDLSQSAWDRHTFSAAADWWKHINSERAKGRTGVGAGRSGGSLTWDGILLEEVFEALAEKDLSGAREELIQVAAVAVAMVEYIDRTAT
jgi:hypothetical protein